MTSRQRAVTSILVVGLWLWAVIDHPTYAYVSVSQQQTVVPLEELLNPHVEEEVEIKVCSSSSVKTYMDYLKISPTSYQGKFIRKHMTAVDGLLYDKDLYIGVALGSYFGPIGSRYTFILDTGIQLNVIKVEAKSDWHTVGGCQQRWDGSVIEFVIDMESENFPRLSNKHPFNGNFNNAPQFKGNIVKIIDRGELK